MHMYCWRSSQFVAVAQAVSVKEARKKILDGLGECSQAVRSIAEKVVAEQAPEIWYGPNAEIVVTDSAALEQADELIESLQREMQAAKDQGFFVGDSIKFSTVTLRNVLWRGGPSNEEENVRVDGITRQPDGSKALALTQTRDYIPAQLHCECRGCCAEHPVNEKCSDLREVVIGVMGSVVLAVCKECAVELAKTLFS